MRIRNDRLQGDDGKLVAFEESPNQRGVFGSGDPRYLIMHYTAGGAATGSISWLTNPAAKASVHLVIGREGEITQLVRFDWVAWHAGRSSWAGLDGLNRHSIGIELANWGHLKGSPGAWRSRTDVPISDDRVEVAIHKHESKRRGWEIYSEAQTNAALAAAAAIVTQYGLRDVLGHDDISPGRKQDPGPLFPMDWFRGMLFGRSEDDSAVLRVTATRLNIRSGPGLEHAPLPEGPLANGTVVQLVEANGKWRMIHALDQDGIPFVTGWVHGDFIG